MINFCVDRQEPNSKKIESKMDFNKVLSWVELEKKGRKFLLTPWFYGTVGFAMLISFLCFIYI